MKKPELLAPAGSMESLIAAINAGCDAVYISGKKYGARAFAENFTEEQIIEAIKLCHLYGVKIYVTVNTLIFENEVEDFLNYVDFLHFNNVDAIIIQDIGMMDILRKKYPNLEIHASTQMHIHNLESVKLMEKLKIKRVVLARETSIEQVEQIRKNTNIELEIFAHGALCISYSGQCLMSYLIGGRSGNRGACAGSCRLPYSIYSNNKKINENDYILSMKDLNTLYYIDKLINIGVDSIKLEGRMKRPEYVYLVVSLYRKAIDSYITTGNINITDADIKELKKIFNREFTKGFLFNEKNENIVNDKKPNHQGIIIGKVIDYNNEYATIKLIDSLNINDGIRFISKNDVGFTLTSMFKNKKRINEAKKDDIVSIKVKEKLKKDDIVVKTTDYKQLNEIKQKIKINKKIKIKCMVIAKEGVPLEIQYSDYKNNVKVIGNIVEKSINSPITKEKIKQQLSKLGDTIYYIDNIDIISDNNIFINIKELNELRRNLVSLLNNKRLYEIKYVKKDYKIELPNLKQKEELNLEISNINILNKLKQYRFDKIYTKNKQLLNLDDRILLKLPRVKYDYEDYDNLLLIGEIGSLNKYKNVETDFSFNVTNSYSVAFLHSMGVKKVTLSYELNEDTIKQIYENYINRYNKEPNIEIIIASRKEAIVSKYNLNNKYNIKDSYLVDRLNKKYPILDFENIMYIYNNKYDFNKINLKINKRIIVDFEDDINNNLLEFIRTNSRY